MCRSGEGTDKPGHQMFVQYEATDNLMKILLSVVYIQSRCINLLSENLLMKSLEPEVPRIAEKSLVVLAVRIVAQFGKLVT